MSKSSQQTTFNKQEAMLTALHASMGAVTKAAAIAEITPQTHYNWYKNDEEYHDRVDNIKFVAYEKYREMVLDAVAKKIEEGNTSVINKCFTAFLAKWPEEMERYNPYKPRTIAVMKYVEKPKA
jgi:hypothetical protein